MSRSRASGILAAQAHVLAGGGTRGMRAAMNLLPQRGSVADRVEAECAMLDALGLLKPKAVQPVRLQLQPPARA